MASKKVHRLMSGWAGRKVVNLRRK